MPVSFSHEGFLELFRHRPELAAKLLRDALGVELPAYSEARVVSGDLTEAQPVELRADLVILLRDDKPVLVIVLEVQLGRDDDKPFSWPHYLAAVRSRYRCEACLFVVTPLETIAAWARRPIRLGPNNTFEPYVLGPAAVPAVDDPTEAASLPELAVLSATAHGNDPKDGAQIALAAIAAASGLPDELAALYYDLIRVSLNDAARRALEELMSQGHYQYQSDFAKKYVAEGEAKGKAEGKAVGKAEGKAEALLDILAARGLTISDAQRARVLACTDLTVLAGWLKRAVT
ncbi:MAG: hypothetical protein JNL21_41800, partial [Myxococcales bacterium]|nr:hypothetical protein [Myxococcales bacterium]